MYDGRVIANRYDLGRALGSGGFATVYEAKDRAQDRVVAVKVIPLASVPSDEQAEIVERFRLEALALSQLKSPNVARVYDFGRDESAGLYLVMERIDGVTLDPKSLGRPLLAHEVLRAARALLSGLGEAHASRLVHRDVKPSNVLVPGGIAGLGDLKVLDFGIAQSEHRAMLEADLEIALDKPRRALGTPAYMAPELLLGEASSPASDVYAAGLVLYELLGHTLLFPDRPAREQQALRTQRDPELAGRVPAPLDTMLARMLAREPEKRFLDAVEALGELVDMETAPVDLDAILPPASQPPRRRSIPPPEPSVSGQTRRWRLSRLEPEGPVALAATFHALDLPMLDALARRERGSETSRVARALTLGLRLEIDAASLLLAESGAHPLAHAVAVCVLAPRARAATKARIARAAGDDTTWIDDVDPTMGALLVAMEAALCGPAEIDRCVARAERLLGRAAAMNPSARVTLELAHLGLGARARSAMDEGVRAFEALAATDPSPPSLSVVLRALVLGPLAFRVDDHVVRACFERASHFAAEAGATLLETRALASWGGMLVEVPGRLQQGLAVLERVTTLLLHADVPSLEHLAAHNRAVGFLVEGRFADAAEQFKRAREVASGEAPLEFEILSGAQELSARLAAGDVAGARAVARLLDLSRNVPVAPREALLVASACSLVRLFDDDLAAARADLARARAGAESAGDAILLAGVIDVLHAAAAGEPIDYLAKAAELHRIAEEHGFAAFYWFDLLRAVVANAPERLRAPMSHAADRLVVLLGTATKG